MTLDQHKAFLGKIKGDSNLQEKLKAATDVDAALAIAKEAGFSISADDVRNEISDSELERAAGGEYECLCHCTWDDVTSCTVNTWGLG